MQNLLFFQWCGRLSSFVQVRNDECKDKCITFAQQYYCIFKNLVFHQIWILKSKFQLAYTRIKNNVQLPWGVLLVISLHSWTQQDKSVFPVKFFIDSSNLLAAMLAILSCKMYSVRSWGQRGGGHIGFVTQRIDHQKWNCISMGKLCIWRQSSHWETKE